MLELRPNCECCDIDLPYDSPEARICTIECTWCDHCINGHFGGACPNCGGNTVARPIRPVALIDSAPPSTERKYRSDPCPAPR